MTDTQKALRQEIAALEHELRRVNEALERNRTHPLEQRAGQLRDNIALCKRDLDEPAVILQSSANKP